MNKKTLLLILATILLLIVALIVVHHWPQKKDRVAGETAYIKFTVASTCGVMHKMTVNLTNMMGRSAHPIGLT